MYMIQGVERKSSDGYITYCIMDVSDELKNVIREKLTLICHGRDKADSTRRMYSYKSTVKEFVKRYKENNVLQGNNRNKGMIGELLFHILMTEEQLYSPVSAFFNLEERSFKKGFDVAYYQKDTSELWIAEVKSGEKQPSQKNISATAVSLINTAKNDLKTRLTSTNDSLWLNAVNHARIALNEVSDEKKAVCKILEDYGDDAAAGIYNSNDKNVILVGVVFHNTADAIEEKKIQGKHSRIAKEKIFKSCIVVCIQQKAYDEVFQFLLSEAENEE